MIARDATPVYHESPYRRIDIRYIGRKRVITREEWVDGGDRREPDAAVYRFNYNSQSWILKDS